MKRLYYALFFYICGYTTLYAAQTPSARGLQQEAKSTVDPRQKQTRRGTQSVPQPAQASYKWNPEGGEITYQSEIDPETGKTVYVRRQDIPGTTFSALGSFLLDSPEKVDIISRDIQHLKPTKANKEIVQKVMGDVTKESDVPSECKRELQLVIEDFNDQCVLQEHNVNVFTEKNKHNLALLHALRKTHSAAADILVAQKIQEPSTVFGEKKEEAKTKELEQKPTVFEQLKPSIVLGQEKTKVKEEFEKKAEVEQPKQTVPKPSTVLETPVELPAVPRTVEKKPLEEDEGIINAYIAEITDLIKDFNLSTFHMRLHAIASDIDAGKELLQELKNFKDDIMRPEILFEIFDDLGPSKPPQLQLQNILARLHAYLFASFDALLAGVYDAKEVKTGWLSALWSFSDNDMQDKYKAIEQALLVGLELSDIIEWLVAQCMPLMVIEDSFNKREFDPTLYFDQTRIIKNGIYIYKRTTKNDVGQAIVLVDRFHKKKENYSEIIRKELIPIQQKLKELNVEVQEVPIIKPALTELQELKLSEEEVAREQAQEEEFLQQLKERLKETQAALETPPQKPGQKPETVFVQEPSEEEEAQLFAFLREQGVPEEELAGISKEELKQIIMAQREGVAPSEVPQYIEVPPREIPKEVLEAERDETVRYYAKNLQEKFIVPYKLRDLHTIAFGFVTANKKQMEFAQERLQDTLEGINTILPSMDDELTRMYPDSTPPQQELQNALNTILACLCVSFDALIASVYDAQHKPIEKVASNLWGYEEEQTPEEIKQKTIEKYVKIKHALIFGQHLADAIETMFVPMMLSHMIEQSNFEQSTFNVRPYFVQDTIIKNGEYVYKRSATKDGKTSIYIDQRHKKKTGYLATIEVYMKGIDKKLQDLGTFVERPQVPSYVEVQREEPTPIKPEVPVLEEKKIEPTPEMQMAEEVQEPEKEEKKQEIPKKIKPVQEVPVEPRKEQAVQEVPEPPKEQVEEKVAQAAEPEQPEKPEELIIEEEKAEEISPEKIKEARAAVQQAIREIEAKTKQLSDYHKHSVDNKYTYMFSQDDLQAYVTDFNKWLALDPSNEQLEIKFRIQLIKYGNQLVQMVLLDDPVALGEGDKIEKFLLSGLPTIIHGTPLTASERVTEFLETLQDLQPYQTLIDTLVTLKDLELYCDQLDKAFAMLCTMFDAYVAGMMNQQNMQTVEIDTYKESLAKGQELFQGLWETFIGQWPDFISPQAREEFYAKTFDVTKYKGELTRNGAYIYAVPADNDLTIGSVRLKTVEINALHEKDYATILSEFLITVEQAGIKSAIQKILEQPEELTAQDIEEHLADLESIKDILTDEEYEALKVQLEQLNVGFTESEILEAIIATFKKEVEKAEQELQQNKITSITSFDPLYKQIQEIVRKNQTLKVRFQDSIDAMVALFESYITHALDTLIEVGGLTTLHLNVQGKTQDALKEINNALPLRHISTIATMIDQLKKNKLFGITSIENTQSGKELQKALIRGFAYILVAYDALEASLYEDFTTTQRLTQWVQYLFTGSAQEAETLYDKAIKTLDIVMNRLDELREQYFITLIDPFFVDWYKKEYQDGKLDVTKPDYGLEDIIDEKGVYRYARGVVEAYPGNPFLIGEGITSLHKKDYQKIRTYWKKFLEDRYKTELITQKQKAVLQSIVALQLPELGISMQNIIHVLETNPDQVVSALRQQIDMFAGVAEQLEILKKQNAITPEIRGALELAYEYLLGAYDALFAYVYDAIKEMLTIKDEEQKKIFRRNFVQTLQLVGSVIVSNIMKYMQLFTSYFNETFIRSLNDHKLLIGEDIGAMYQGTPQFYLFARPLNYPVQNKLTSDDDFKKQMEEFEKIPGNRVILVSGSKRSPFLIVSPMHGKTYRGIFNSWQPVIQEVLNPTSIEVVEVQRPEEAQIPAPMPQTEIEQVLATPETAQSTKTVEQPPVDVGEATFRTEFEKTMLTDKYHGLSLLELPDQINENNINVIEQVLDKMFPENKLQELQKKLKKILESTHDNTPYQNIMHQVVRALLKIHENLKKVVFTTNVQGAQDQLQFLIKRIARSMAKIINPSDDTILEEILKEIEERPTQQPQKQKTNGTE